MSWEHVIILWGFNLHQIRVVSWCAGEIPAHDTDQFLEDPDLSSV